MQVNFIYDLISDTGTSHHSMHSQTPCTRFVDHGMKSTSLLYYDG
jgi:hypothetical protein